ncbi:hypothetical protein ACA910_001845 [Epithemia clementina (nom. ined.)]
MHDSTRRKLTTFEPLPSSTIPAGLEAASHAIRTSSSQPPSAQQRRLGLHDLHPDLKRHIISFFIGFRSDHYNCKSKTTTISNDEQPQQQTGANKENQTNPTLGDAAAGRNTDTNCQTATALIDLSSCWLVVDVDSIQALALTCRAWKSTVYEPQLWNVQQHLSSEGIGDLIAAVGTRTTLCRHSFNANYGQEMPDSLCDNGSSMMEPIMTKTTTPGHSFLYQPTVDKIGVAGVANNARATNAPCFVPVGFVKVLSSQTCPPCSTSNEQQSTPTSSYAHGEVDCSRSLSLVTLRVREHASQQEFVLVDYELWHSSSSHPTLLPSHCRPQILQHCLKEHFVYSFCYALQCSSPGDLFQLYQSLLFSSYGAQSRERKVDDQNSTYAAREEPRTQRQRRLLRVPYMSLEVSRQAKGHLQQQPQPHPPRATVVRTVYLPNCEPLANNMLDTHDGHLVLLEYSPLQAQRYDQALCNVLLHQHYCSLERAHEEAAFGCAFQYDTNRSGSAAAAAGTARAKLWFKLMDWVCHVVQVLELPPQVAFRSAIFLQPLQEQYFDALQQRRRMAPIQLVAAALVYIASCMGSDGSSQCRSNDDDTNKINTPDNVSSSTSFPTSKIISLENLAFCVDNHWNVNAIFQVVVALWLNCGGSCGGVGENNQGRGGLSIASPGLSLTSFATPTVENWVDVYKKTTFTALEDLEAVSQLAHELAWFILPTALYTNMAPRHLGACLVAAARWTIELCSNRRGGNRANKGRELPITIPLFEDDEWVSTWLWSPLPALAATCTWQDNVAPYLSRVLETLHHHYHHHPTQIRNPTPADVRRRRQRLERRRQLFVNQDDDERRRQVFANQDEEGHGLNDGGGGEGAVATNRNMDYGVEAAAALVWQLPR